jgi:hypothetical protein
VVTARSSDSKMERPNLSSSNARIPAVSHGPFSSEDITRRVSLRYYFPHLRVTCASTRIKEDANETANIGSSKEALPPYRQVPKSNRRSIPRCHQGTTQSKTRGPIRCTTSRNQGGQGEASRSPERKEGREGEKCCRCREGTSFEIDEQAGSKGCAKEGPSYQPLMDCFTRGVILMLGLHGTARTTGLWVKYLIDS